MKYFTILIFLTLSFYSYGQSNPKIKFSNTDIKVDGIFDEAIWNEIPMVTGFYNYAPNDEGLARRQTQVKLFHNNEFLFVNVVYQDTTSRNQVSALKRDVPIGLSDGMVILLDTQNQQQNAYYFSVNAYGAQIDGLVERINEGYDFGVSWNTVWKSAVTTQNNNKQYELAIPLKALNFNPNQPIFGIQFYMRDIKINSWTILKNVKRNYRLFDLRFTQPFELESLKKNSTSRFTVTPSITANYQDDLINELEDTKFKPSLDMQYNLNSSLKIDATINPDFSQIDVDQQVTNLTRFSLFFPERRNFFLENSDLFSNLGVEGVNPFYSRRIGANSDIQFGLKLSGNIAPRTRIGILNVQTNKAEDVGSQNFSAIITEQQLTDNFTATGYLINRQETDKFDFINDYNRVAGLNVNFKSTNNKWTGVTNYGKSLNSDIEGDNDFYNTAVYYNRRGFTWNVSIKDVGKNYITDVGFTPRLYNYNAIDDTVIREGYTEAAAGFEIEKFLDQSKTLNSVRVLNYTNNTYFDGVGKLNQMSHFFNSAIFFKNLSSLYYVFTYDIEDLKYGFDILGNGNYLMPDKYQFGQLKLGYNSANNQKFRYRFNAQYGSYYSGKLSSGGAYLNYQLLPYANIELSYDINSIDLNSLGKETFHLARFTGVAYFSNRLNWTTYLQYNTQRDNFNINSRLQWEYKPLSYIYLVVTDNLTENFSQKNWGVAFKMNYRFDF